MERRTFLKAATASAAGTFIGADYWSVVNAAVEEHKDKPIPRRPYKDDVKLSIIGFGAIVVVGQDQSDANREVARSIDRGINYFDVAPTYGNAQERLGPALKPYRDKCFLACKTTERDAKGARKELEESFRLLQTDHFDLYQLHAITTLEDVEQAFAKGGAMETFLKAKEDGKVRYLGFSAHSEVAAHAAMDRYDFDSILFPLSFPIWIKEGFGPSVHQRAEKDNRGILALKAMAHQKWPEGTKRSERPWKKTWYEPFDNIDKVSLGLRFPVEWEGHDPGAQAAAE